MRVNERMKKVFSILLCLCMVAQYVPTTAFAIDAAESGLCEHHAEHTAECGYAEAVAGVPCAHVHDENCGYVEAVEEVLCACEATDENGAIVHTEGCGYVAPVAGSDCTHAHDEVCGYAEAVEAHECHYECAECAIAPANEEPGDETPVCTCTVKCGETVDTTCAVCYAEGADLSAVCNGAEEPPVAATNNIDAAAMTPEELKAAVDAALAARYTAITVNLAENADATMFSAITAALAADYVADGTVDLTISGAKTVPECGFFDYGDYSNNDDKNIAGDKLKSLTLTDVETIGEYAFSACTYLESVNLPQVVTIGEYAFNEWKKGTKLTALDLPNATTIGDWAFAYSSFLTSVNLPKVTSIGMHAFGYCDLRTLNLPEVTTIDGEAFYNNENLVSCSAPKVATIGFYPWGNCSRLETLELTAAGDFTLSNNLFAYTPTGQINLVLHKDKESQVTQNDDGTATWKTTNSQGENLQYTFKSITFVYSIEVSAIENGAVTADKSTATEGETVTLTVTAAEGYILDTLTVMNGGTPVEVTGNSFTMPAGDVTVSATFKACDHTGGEATCTERAVCDSCGESYGDLDPDAHAWNAGRCTRCGARELFFEANVSWYKVWAYYWVDNTHAPEEWPGVELTKNDEESMYRLVVPGDTAYIIFHDGNNDNGNKTQDLKLGEANCYHYNVNNGEQYWYTYPCAEHSWQNGKCSNCRKACSHTGGTATCTEQAKCEVCGTSYGEISDHTAAPTYAPTADGSQHVATYSCCGSAVTENHTTDETTDQTCKGYFCTACENWYGEPNPNAHTFGENSRCTVCGAACTHSSFADGECTACGIPGGYCGSYDNEGGRESLWWYFLDGTLTISGAGDMANMLGEEFTWEELRNSITALVIDKDVTGISGNAFYNLTKLKSVTFAEGSLLTAIGNAAFASCSSLTEITIPAGVTDIGSDHPFADCTAMENVRVEPGNTVYKDIDGVLYTIDGTTLLYYPHGQTLSGITFIPPKGVTTIGNSAFASTKVRSVELTNDLTTVGESAFDNCTMLYEITISNSVKEIDESAFWRCTELRDVHAPCGWQENPLYKFENNDEIGNNYVNVRIDTHDFDSWVPDADGLTHNRACRDCGHVTDESMSHSTTAEGDKAATCTTLAYCSVCESEYGEKSQTNHDESVVYTEADNGFCPNCDAYQPAVLNGEVYEISNAGQLYWFAAYGTNANAILKNDIVVNQNVLNEDGTLSADSANFRSWTPIHWYSGTFDGQNHTISGLYFDYRDGTYVGLFGELNGTVRNVGIVDSYFYGHVYVGGVVGDNEGTVTGCYNTGTVKAAATYPGGVVGCNKGTVTGCYNTGTVKAATTYPGGVVGNNTGTVTGCYNTGTVSGNNYGGGVVGNNTGTVTGCYNTGTVSGRDNVGGVAGNNYRGTITSCYYLTGTANGGIAGADTAGQAEAKTTGQFASGEVTWLLNGESAEGVWKQTLNADSVPGFTGGTVYYGYVDCGSTEAVYTNTTVSTEPVEHDYDNGFCEQVSGQTHYEPATLVTTENCTELGLADSYIGYYAITNAGQLYWFAAYGTNANAILKNDIVVNQNVLNEDGTLSADSANFRSWTPIHWYSGTFDGQNHTISGLYFDDRDGTYVGLFDELNGTVRNVGIVDSYFYCHVYVGGVVGYNKGTVTGCYNTGTVKAAATYPGGIVGYNKGTVTGCYNTGTVKADVNFAGGVVGNNTGTVTGCYNTGTVNGNNYGGGVVGNNTGTVTGCYNTGTVSGNNYGGVAGKNDQGTITSCYYLTGTANGGIAGADTAGQAEAKTAEQFASGEVAYLLRTRAAAGTNVWGQNLDNGQTVQTVPTFDGADVYHGYASCADTKVKYTNNASASATPIAHDWGCTATGAQIVGTCDGCGTDGGKVTLTLDGTAVYDGTEKTVKADGSLKGIDTLPGVTYAGDRINVGTFTANLTLENGTKAQLEVTITAKEITPTIEGMEDSYTYTGFTIKPTVTVKDGETVLREGTDYDVTYGENTNCATGGSVKVTLTGNYEGSAKETFAITAKEITPTVEGMEDSYTYTGFTIKPTVTVKDGETVLREGTDYDVTCGENTNCATGGSVKVTLKGNYEGSAEETFAIAPKEVTELTFVGLNEVYAHTGEAIVPTFNVKDGQTTLSEGVDYTAAVTNNTDVGTATITITLKENYTGTVTKTFEIKPHVHEWSFTASGDTITAECKGTIGECPVKTATIKIAAEDKTYDGNPVTATLTGNIDGVDTPAIRYFKNGVELNESVINAGTYTASIKLGEAEAKVNFTIAKADLDFYTLKDSKFAEGLVYDGTEKALVTEPGSIESGTIVFSLVPKGEYTTTIPVATEAGEYVVYWFAQGDENHKDIGVPGEAYCTVTIAAKPVTDATVTLGEYDSVYNGTAKEPGVASVIVDSMTLTAGKDYTVTYSNNVNAGTATVTIQGIGNFTDTVNKTFTISKAAATVTAVPTAKKLTYTGEAQALVNAGTTADGKLVYSLSENGEFTETIPVGTNAGEYTVWYYVKGDDNHSDSAKASMKVTIAQAKTEISVATTPITVTYGETVELPTATSNFGTVSCDKTAAELVNAGTYRVTYTVEGTDNYEGDSKTVTVTVEKLAVAEPTVTSTHTYTKSEQTAQLADVESYMTIASGNKGINAGNYEVIITLDGNHKWADGSDGKVQWSIGKAQAQISVNTDPITVIYGETVTLPTVTTNFGTVVCDKTAADLVNAGTYTVTYTVAGTDNYDGDTKSLTVTVGQKAVTEPTVSGTYTYTGNEQTVTLTGVESYMTVASGNKGTNADSYEVVITLDGNHKWAAGSDGKVQWSIAKAKAEIAVNTGPITITYGEIVTLPTATTNFGSVVCDKTAADLVNAGTYTVTYTVAGTDNFEGDTKSITVAVNAKAITEADVKLNGSLIYNGKAQTQPITVTAGITYEVTGNKATNAGEYELTVKGTGNYTGSVTLDWTIAKAKLTIASDSKVIYIGEKLPMLTYTASGLVGGDKLTKEPTLTTNAKADQAGSYTITATNADAGDNYTITYVSGSLTIMDKETEVETKIKQTELTEVPDGLKNTEFNTIEAITEELISRILAVSTVYAEEDMVHYDVTLQFSLDNGNSWTLATEENFPTEGITVILPYPEGTNARDYEFVVSHMFTVTSQRLGTVAGEVEMPKVEETANGIRVILNGLSPVTVAARYHDHTGGTATCTEKAVCTICGNAYGEVDKTNHAGGTEVKDAKEATCGAEGYTGDTYCKGCNEVVEKGAAIKATGNHTYGDWKAVKEPTKTTKGEKQRTCSVCGHVDSKEIPVLSDTPATGDGSNIILYGSMFTVSLAGLVVLLLAAKKRKQAS